MPRPSLVRRGARHALLGIAIGGLWALPARAQRGPRGPDARAARAVRLRAALEKIAHDADGRVGIAVAPLDDSGQVIVGDGHHPMQSVYKLPIAMAVLHEVDAGRLSLDRPVTVGPSIFVTPGQHSPIRDRFPRGTTLSVRALVRYALTESDGTACDVLLSLLDGPAAATIYLHGIGVPGVVIATTERQQGLDPRLQYRNWSTPAGALGILRAVRRPVLSDSLTALLMRDLTETTTGPARLRGRLPAGAVVAHKTGSSGTRGGVTAATNDIGIITLPDGHALAVAVFLTDSRAPTAEREDVIARVARAAWDAWTDGR